MQARLCSRKGRNLISLWHACLLIISSTGEDDFNSTSFEVTFPADEGLRLYDVHAPIPIFDDEIDEAVTQLFVARLEVLDAVNFDLITTSRTVSMCRIIDDDGQ